ncbi:MAG: RNA-binding protein [Myxococcota bacterium]
MSSSSKLFVGGLSYSTTDQSLHEYFNKIGEVLSAKVIVDHDTGDSRGFGFVEFAAKEDAEKAIEEYNDKDFEGRRINVSVARERGRSRERDDSRERGRSRERDDSRERSRSRERDDSRERSRSRERDDSRERDRDEKRDDGPVYGGG